MLPKPEMDQSAWPRRSCRPESTKPSGMESDLESPRTARLEHRVGCDRRSLSLHSDHETTTAAVAHDSATLPGIPKPAFRPHRFAATNWQVLVSSPRPRCPAEALRPRTGQNGSNWRGRTA